MHLFKPRTGSVEHLSSQDHSFGGEHRKAKHFTSLRSAVLFFLVVHLQSSAMLFISSGFLALRQCESHASDCANDT